MEVKNTFLFALFYGFILAINAGKLGNSTEWSFKDKFDLIDLLLFVIFTNKHLIQYLYYKNVCNKIKYCMYGNLFGIYEA